MEKYPGKQEDQENIREETGGKHLSSVTTLSKKGWPPDPCSTWHFRRVAKYNTLLAYD